ncbi:MAG: hypothetical protein WEC14_02250, partial [Chloroflexota bacterium]
MAYRRVGPLIAIALVAAACGTPSEPVDSAPPAAGAIPRCDDVPMLSAPAGAYRDRPIYVGNEQPTEELRAWAQTKPGFEDIWIDRDHQGWVSLGFSQGVAERQVELATEFPDVGVVAVEVKHGAAELEALQRRIHEVLPPEVVGGSSAMVHRGVVEV